MPCHRRWRCRAGAGRFVGPRGSPACMARQHDDPGLAVAVLCAAPQADPGQPYVHLPDVLGNPVAHLSCPLLANLEAAAQTVRHSGATLVCMDSAAQAAGGPALPALALCAPHRSRCARAWHTAPPPPPRCSTGRPCPQPERSWCALGVQGVAFSVKHRHQELCEAAGCDGGSGGGAVPPGAVQAVQTSRGRYHPLEQEPQRFGVHDPGRWARVAWVAGGGPAPPSRLLSLPPAAAVSMLGLLACWPQPRAHGPAVPAAPTNC